MIGAMKHRLTLQARQRVADGAGGYSETWADIADEPIVYAAIETLGAAEVYRQQQISAAATHRLLIRYRADVTPDMRLCGEAGVFDITGVLDRHHRKEYLEVLATNGL